MTNTAGSTKKVAPKIMEKAKVVGKTYTYEEAIAEVLKMYDTFGNMPKEDDYEAKGIDTNALLAALDVKGDDMRESVIRNNSKPYAGVNILTLRELRRRKGEKIYIATSKEGTSWKEFTTNSGLFPII